MKKATPTPPALVTKERLRREANYHQLVQVEVPPAELVEEALCALPEEAAQRILDETDALLPDGADDQAIEDAQYGAVMWRVVALARLHQLSTEYGATVVNFYERKAVSVASIADELKADLGAAWAKMVGAGFPSWKQVGEAFRTRDGSPSKRFKARGEAISAFMAARYKIDVALGKAMAA
jgi:hypothetical protein